MFDPTILVAISCGDATTERDILKDYRRANVDDVAMLKQAIDSGEMVQITRAVHRIKGASQTVGAVGLAAVCKQMEEACRAKDWEKIRTCMGDFDQEWNKLSAFLTCVIEQN